MIKEIKSKSGKAAIVGLGYVGLPVALTLAKKVSVIGYDINTKNIKMLQKSKDPNGELDSSYFENTDILITDNADDLKEAICFIITVPTPVDDYKVPDLSSLINATTTVAAYLKKGDYVIYESTVYPGCTEERCVPILEEISGLKFGKDFKVGYSPERINPGDKEHTLQNIIKVVSGSDEEALEQISELYEMVTDAGVHRAPTIKSAEAAKIIENVQRDVNIALMNELSIIFGKLDINTNDVLKAAGTKWNFLPFVPGLVGGHCIGVDPYYLTYKAKEIGYQPQVILAGRSINDQMGSHVARNTLQLITQKGKDIAHAKVLIMGATFKENVSDIRNSKVADIVKELEAYSVKVEVIDPSANGDVLKEEYGFELKAEAGSGYDAVILAVCHKEYADLDEEYFKGLMSDDGILVDVKGLLKDKISDLTYWSL